ncbi:MAG TPA: hypothetical protein VNJ01_15065 [Bacteriovoracaceae bacterium]|nr:hypothetical protein [Bacteriovoracaceae bacterium]
MNIKALTVLITVIFSTTSFARCEYDLKNIKSVLNALAVKGSVEGVETTILRGDDDGYGEDRVYTFTKKNSTTWTSSPLSNDTCHAPDCHGNYLHRIKSGCLLVDGKKVKILRTTKKVLSYETPMNREQYERITLKLLDDGYVDRVQKTYLDYRLDYTEMFIGR